MPGAGRRRSIRNWVAAAACAPRYRDAPVAGAAVLGFGHGNSRTDGNQQMGHPRRRR